jgi:hypothetical protein
MKKQQTAMEWLKKELEDYGSSSHLNLDWNTFDELCQQAKEKEKQQIGYTKEDVLMAGFIGEINHFDTKHIVSLLDEAKQYNETHGDK